MIWIDRLALFSPLDFAALGALLLFWIGIGWRIEHPRPARPSVSALMAGYRRLWMAQMVTRQPRMFDSSLVGQLRQTTAFFTSAAMIAIGGGLALIGNAEQIAGVAQDFALGGSPAFVWEIKVLVVLLLLTNAFLKFVWANRLFGYCSIVMGSVPNDPEDPLAYPRAAQAAELSITAGRSFNRGLRATYFALAAMTWLAGAVPLLLATLVTSAVLYRREFVSQSRQVLAELPPQTR